MSSEGEKAASASAVEAHASSSDGKRKAAPQQQQQPCRKKKTILYDTPEQMYGVSVTNDRVVDVCAGCLGSRNVELRDNPIVLCDGEGCGREYHLQCCLPPLSLEEIPEGSYLCIDCDPDGASSQLETYFEHQWEARSKFKTSREYFSSLFDKNEVIPISEFPRITELHYDAIGTVRNIQAASTPDRPLGPDFLVGKPLRLYCPDGNSYHSGRIIDWRRATHLRPESAYSQAAAEKDCQYGDISEIAQCEFLVAFPAGLDFRKRTIHQWIILEEHSLAVGTSLIWAYDSRKKDWSPGLTWLRTSLELMPILERLSSAEGQVIFDTKSIGRTKTWALTQVFGKENHLLLVLREEAVDLFSPTFAERFSTRARPVGHDDGPRVDIPIMLAYTEIQEQRRIRDWYKLPLQNARHERAITIADSYSLPPLEVGADKDDDVIESIPRACPLIRPGLDRMWVMQRLQAHGFDQTKDTAAGIELQGVKSRSAAFKKLHEQAKAGASSVSS